VGEAPQRIAAAEKLLLGTQELDAALLDAAAKAVMDAIDPGSDLHVSGDYRRHVAGALTRRVVRAAFERAKGQRQ
jgi:aerobic carbon-monoxide dehydrogenase medium subunit